MVRPLVPGLILFGSAVLVGCGAGSPTPSSNTHGGSSSGGAAGGPAGGGSNKGGSGGAPSSAAGAGGSTAIAGASGTGVSGGAGGVSTAGAGGSLGTAGSGSGGVAGGAGASSGAPPLFSDDFEAAAIDTTKWTLRVNSDPTSTFSLDTSQKHGGKQSLHLKQTGFSSMLAAEGAPIFAAPDNSYYARVWLRVASASGGGLPTGHVIWIETGDVTNDTHEVRVGANLGYFQSNLIPSDTDIRDPAAAMTTDAWHCIQLHYGNDLLDVTLDGVHSSISTTNWVAANSANGGTTPKSGWSPTYAAFRIGWELAGGEIWFDDVALDHVPVACN
jgi:hypothetical protein